MTTIRTTWCAVPRTFAACTVTVRLPTAEALALPEIVALPLPAWKLSPAGSFPLTRVIRDAGLPVTDGTFYAARPSPRRTK